MNIQNTNEQRIITLNMTELILLINILIIPVVLFFVIL